LAFDVDLHVAGGGDAHVEIAFDAEEEQAHDDEQGDDRPGKFQGEVVGDLRRGELIRAAAEVFHGEYRDQDADEPEKEDRDPQEQIKSRIHHIYEGGGLFREPERFACVHILLLYPVFKRCLCAHRGPLVLLGPLA
jgi:hypothetical protein